MAPDELDRLAERTLHSLREHLLNARNLAKQKPYEKSEGDLGVENWRAISARKGLEDVTRLREIGTDWLRRQAPEVQQEVGDAERELQHLLAEAIGDGGHALPVDLPDDPFA